MSLTKRGISLVELVVAVAVTGLLAAFTAAILARAAGQLRERSERIAREQALRVAGQAVTALLKSPSAAGIDLTGWGASAFTLRVGRGSGVICESSSSRLLVRRGSSWWRAVRQPVAGRDSLFLGRLDAPGWLVLPLPSPPGVARCPDGSPAWAFPAASEALPAAAIGPGSPFRFFEPIEVRIYPSAGADWLGLRLIATGESIQPLAGPLVRSASQFEYLDQAGRPAPVPSEISSIRFRMTAVGAAGGVADSARGLIALRGGW